MMRIAMIGSKGMLATVGGIERHVEDLSAKLAERGFRVSVYSRPWYTGHAPWSERVLRGVRVITLPSLRTKHLDAISHTFLATLHAMRERPEVYHFHGVGPALVSFLPRMFRPSARVIATFHCVDRQHAKWGAVARFALALGERAACAFPHETIAVSPTLAAYCRERYGRSVSCIPNGVHVRAPMVSATRDAALAPFGLRAGSYVLTVARLIPHKGVHTVIEAFRKFRIEYPEHAHLRLAVVGGPSFTDRYVAELARAAGGDLAIVFLGAQHTSTLDALYDGAIALVHASRSEGLPIVLLESAAHGVMAIASDILEHRSILASIGGLLFHVGDPNDLVAKIAMVAQCAPESRGRIAASLRASVARAYAWDDIADRVEERYRNAENAVTVRGEDGWTVPRVSAAVQCT